MSTFIQELQRPPRLSAARNRRHRPSVGGTLTERTTMPRRKAPGFQIVAADTALFLTLSEQVAQRIADEILNERFASGARLKEVDLATMYGVSRASIREALRLLDKRGLVWIEPRRGARVTQLWADEVDDLYELRASMLPVGEERRAGRGPPRRPRERRALRPAA